MNELEISVVDASEGSPKNEFRSVVGKFEEQHSIKVTCTSYDWGNAWGEIMKIMLYKHGPVMSQVGTTWLGSLDATQGLRPFSPLDINQLGGAAAYHPAAWASGISLETGQITAIPWFLDTYVLYYRKDLLEKAGVDETKAFESYEALGETIEKLARTGVTIPIAMPTGFSSRANLHSAACWVWNQGGEFISDDGKQLLLSESKTRQGLKAYFSLVRHTPKAGQALSDADCYHVFIDGSAAITLRNTSLLYMAERDPILAARFGRDMDVAAVPGTSFVGGSSFVLWNHIRSGQETLALSLLKQLTSPETQYTYFEQDGFLPTRVEALQRLAARPFYGPVAETIQRGRSFRKLKLWGLVEERLVSAIAFIWQALYANPDASVDEEIDKVLNPLERRLQLTLSDN